MDRSSAKGYYHTDNEYTSFCCRVRQTKTARVRPTPRTEIFINLTVSSDAAGRQLVVHRNGCYHVHTRSGLYVWDNRERAGVSGEVAAGGMGQTNFSRRKGKPTPSVLISVFVRGVVSMSPDSPPFNTH